MTAKKPIAIIGMACRFPGGGDGPEEFWNLLMDKKDAISQINTNRWSLDYYYHPDNSSPGKTNIRYAGQLDNVYHFEPEFFGLSPRETVQMDPQQRLLLELSWEALEDSGKKKSDISGSDTSVFIGISSLDYSNNRFDDPGMADSYFMTGNTLSIATNRISHAYNLKGPSASIDTACSSSLVALNQACNTLWLGESRMSIVGGVHLLLSPFPYIGFSKATMLSIDGKCRFLDAGANGYVRSEGGAVFFLKLLEDAEKDGDQIHAVILDAGVNTDGGEKSLTVPDGEMQKCLIETIHKRLNIDPNTISYVEAHGTGTQVGDPIEAWSIGESIGTKRPHSNPLPIGSVKTNIGHLEPASGVAGMMKTVLSLKHRIVPASINFETTNPNIDLDKLNLSRVNDHYSLEDNKDPLLMGINSFGFGGSNAHVVLQEYIKHSKATASSEIKIPSPLFLSAENPQSLQKKAIQFSELIKDTKNQEQLEKIFSTANYFRSRHRNSVIAYNPDASGLVQDLQTYGDTLTLENTRKGEDLGENAKVTLVFSGNGCQWLGMGNTLMKNRVFYKTIKHIDSHFKELSGWSLLEAFLDVEGVKLELTEVAQPLLFAMQVGIFEILIRKGLNADMVIGHSVGEISAAYCANKLSLEQAVSLIYHRSDAQGKTRGKGKMAAVQMGQERAEEFIKDLNKNIEIGAINSPRSVTITGHEDSINEAEALLSSDNVFYKKLDLDYAFHSEYMEEVKEYFLENIGEVKSEDGDLEFISTVNDKDEGHNILDSGYWWKNLRDPVQFNSAIEQAVEKGSRIFVEIGAHPVLTGYINECLRHKSIKGKTIPTIKRNSKSEQTAIDNAYYDLILVSEKQKTDKIFGKKTDVISLPEYPWTRQEYIIATTSEGINKSMCHPLLGIKNNSIEGVWTCQVDPKIHPYLNEHVIEGLVVFPAACFIEIILAASRELLGHKEHEISHFEIIRPLVFDDDITREIQVQIDCEELYFKIVVRDRFADGGWNTHVTGKLVRDVNFTSDNLDINDDLFSNEYTITKEELYDLASELNIEYGEGFRGVESVWVDGSRLVSMIHVDEVLIQEKDQYILAPQILDSAFHTVFPVTRKALPEDYGTYLPQSFKSIRVSECSEEIKYCICDIKDFSSGSINTDFRLYSWKGTLVASLSYSTFVKMPVREKLGKPGIYHQVKVPANRTNEFSSSSLPSLKDIVFKLNNNHLIQQPTRKGINYSKQVLPLYEALAIAIAEETFKDLGAHLNEFTLEELISSSDIGEEHELLITYMLNLLADYDKAVKYDDRWRLKIADENDESISIWRAIVADCPEYLPDMLLTMRSGLSLTDIITDSTYQQPDLDNLKHTGQYRKSTGACDLIFKELFSTILKTWPKEIRRLKIIEFIDENSILTKELVNNLPIGFCDYTFIATDEETGLKAADYYRKHINVSVEYILVDIDSLKQEFSEGDIDIIIASNWLYSKDNILKCLMCFSYLLCPGGLFLLRECPPNSLMNINNGLDKNWWSRTDDNNRPSSKQLYAEDWNDMILQSSFSEASLLSSETDESSFLMGAIRETRNISDSEIKEVSTHPWLLINEPGDFSSEVAQISSEMLFDKGISSYVLENDYTHHSEQLESMLETIDREQQSVENILYLACIDMDNDNTSPLLADVYSEYCMGLVDVLKSAEKYVAEMDIRIWLLSVSKNNNPAPSQRILKGLRRVIKNEFPNIDCRHLEIISYDNSKQLASSIIEEISNCDDEDEVLIENGNRKVLRLVNQELISDINQADSQSDSYFKLCVGKNNKIEELEWKVTEPEPVERNQVEIEVNAIGLNYRDVMFSTGMLPAEMLKGGFAGATLGLECAGTISAIGEDVTKFGIGDEVIAFAPASMASHVKTVESALIPKPENWSFEEAATVPTTFFTVYYSLHYLGHLSYGERILIHGAAGGVGLAAIQYARHCGAEIFATAGTPEKRDFLKLLGVDYVLNSRDLSFADEIMEITGGEGVDIVLNSLAGEAVDKNISIIKPFGRFIELGKRDFFLNRKLGLKPFKENITYHGVDADQIFQCKPELTSQLFQEILELFRTQELRPLPYVIYSANDVSAAFKTMQQSHHIGKIILSMQGKKPKVSKPGILEEEYQFKHDATYVVAGGMGGFGLTTARWIAQNGARNIVLVGRSKPDTFDHYTELRKQYLEQGIELLYLQCDISEPVALKKIFRDISKKLPQVKGIFHTAMVLEDHAIRNIEKSHFRDVFSPKIQGAWNLHEISKELDLDIFVLYSSVTTLIGNPGQANYVAANVYMEGLADYRKKLGLPASAIAWDAIMDTGYLARNEELREIFTERLGIQGIHSETALKFLATGLSENHTNYAVFNANWGLVKKQLPVMTSPIFDYVIHGLVDEDLESNEDILELLKDLTAEESHILISNILIDEVAKILHLPKDRLEHNRSIQDLGIDSLMAMELLSAIETKFGIEIPIMALSDTSTIDSLASKLYKQLSGNISRDPVIENKDYLIVHEMAKTHDEDLTKEEIETFAEQLSVKEN